MILENEIWKDIKDYEGLYQVSNLGRVKSVARTIDTTFKGKPIKRQVFEKILKTATYCYGYKYVCLSKDCKAKKCKVHRLVAGTFLENTNNYPVINHKDGNKLNNNVDNLEWCTYKENAIHAVKTGLYDLEHLRKPRKKRCDKE